MKILGLLGRSGSGKTHLLTRLLPLLVARGVRVSTVKHAHHGFDLDQPGKDSYLQKIIQAGFDGVYLDIVDAFEYFEDR